MSNRVYVGNLAWDVKWQDLKDHMKQSGRVNRADVFVDRDGKSKGCGIVEYATSEDARRAIVDLTDTDLKNRQIFVREDREDGGGDGRGEGRGDRGEGRGDRGDRGDGRGDGRGEGRGDMRGGGYRDNRNDRSEGRGGGSSRQRGGRDYDDRRGGGGYNSRYNDNESRGYGKNDDVYARQVFVGNLSYRTTWQSLKDAFRDCGDVVHADIYKDQQGYSKGCGTVLFQEAESVDQAIRQFHDKEFQGRRITVKPDEGPPSNRRRY